MPKPARGERTAKNADKKSKAKKMAGAGSFYGATKKTKGKKSSTSKTKSG
jgi:hypothetical protein